MSLLWPCPIEQMFRLDIQECLGRPISNGNKSDPPNQHVPTVRVTINVSQVESKLLKFMFSFKRHTWLEAAQSECLRYWRKNYGRRRGNKKTYQRFSPRMEESSSSKSSCWRIDAKTESVLRYCCWRRGKWCSFHKRWNGGPSAREKLQSPVSCAVWPHDLLALRH